MSTPARIAAASTGGGVIGRSDAGAAPRGVAEPLAAERDPRTPDEPGAGSVETVTLEPGTGADGAKTGPGWPGAAADAVPPLRGSCDEVVAGAAEPRTGPSSGAAAGEADGCAPGDALATGEDCLFAAKNSASAPITSAPTTKPAINHRLACEFCMRGKIPSCAAHGARCDATLYQAAAIRQMATLSRNASRNPRKTGGPRQGRRMRGRAIEYRRLLQRSRQLLLAGSERSLR